MARLATVAAFGFDDFNPPTLLAVYQRLGCTSLQFYRNVKNPPTVAEALAVANDLGLAFDSIHGVFGHEHDPSSPDEGIRRAALATYQHEAELAAQLGGPAVVVHPAPMCPDPSRINDVVRAQRIDPMRQSMEDLARLGEKQGAVFLIENIPGNYFFGSDARQLAQMIRAVGSPNLRMCFDTGHAHMTTRDSAAADLAACLDVVGYFHINDNLGTMDAHLIPGQGSLNWTAIAEQIGRLPRDVPAMLELFHVEAEMARQADEGLGQRLRQWLAVGGGA